MVFAIFDEYVTFCTERENGRKNRDADRRATRHDTDATERKRARQRTTGALDEAIEYVKAAKFIGDHRFEPISAQCAEEAVDRILDGGKRVSGTRGDGIYDAGTGCEASCVPAGGRGINRTDDGAYGFPNHRFISSGVRSGTPRGSKVRRG